MADISTDVLIIGTGPAGSASAALLSTYGVDNMVIKNATLNPDGWVVHFEADAKDKAGAAVTYVIDGKIANIHLPKRTISGTWKSQKENGAFNIERQ